MAACRKLRDSPVILPLASEGGCQLTMMVRGLFSLLTTVTSFGEELGTVGGVEMFKKGLRLMVRDPCVNAQVRGRHFKPCIT